VRRQESEEVSEHKTVIADGSRYWCRDSRIKAYLSFCGDFGTPEQEVPEKSPTGLPWESCMTMNDTWGYKSYDFKWKSSRILIRYLVDAVSKNGNFLLNVGPKADGLIPQASVKILKEIGAWMQVNGEAIHCTSGCPIEQPEWGRITKRPGKLYAHIFDWPKDQRLRVTVPSCKLSQAYMLADRKQNSLKINRSNGGFGISLPAEACDQVSTVVVLEIEDTGLHAV
jgi:alpha-L-fucosidase